jgi:Uma2 family endonuclease
MAVLEATTLVKETDREYAVQDENERLFEERGERLLAELRQLDLPAEDGIPMESNWHRIEMNLLIDSVHAQWHDRTDYFTGGNMFIYFSLEQVRYKSYRGPDFFVVKDVDSARNRESWIVWEEDGRYPDVIVELASPSTIKVDLGIKKALYEHTFHTSEYFCYDPSPHTLVGWRLTGGVYEEIPSNAQGWLWSEQLNVWLGTWEGEFQRVTATWLRFYTADGQLVLTQGEAAIQRAEAERQRADQLAAKLRALGVKPEE